MMPLSPYLVRAYHQWMEDSNLTPHLLVNCSKSDVIVPKSFIQEGKIVLNISSDAVNTLVISNESISFKTRFNEKFEEVFVPIEAVLTIYAAENGDGIFFEKKIKDSISEDKQKPKLTVLD
ncbi:Stringent starvation protein B [uncultured Candidatus Thioglobus sp.]|nr:Stringent starvation protein B [uncultured Candidatus Thioglobus sp.]